MINFIIYEDNKVMRKLYKDIIRKFMGIKNFNYHVYEFSKYNKEVDNKINKEIIGKKIYILDIEVPGMSGLELARKIRNNGDWTSQIIVITTYVEYKNLGFTNRLLMLDFISKFSNINENLKLSLKVALNILNRQSALSFKYNSEIFQILYNDIYYIEKNLNNNNSTIVTKNNTYTIKCSINKLMETLSNDPRFFKSHRSCIINLNNVISFDIDSNIIKFKNKEINLVSRDKKKKLKDKIMNNNVFK